MKNRVELTDIKPRVFIGPDSYVTADEDGTLNAQTVTSRHKGNLRGKRQNSSIINLDASASYIVGGQIGSQGPKICMIYPEGNYISAREQTPYLQISMQ